jgi:FAD/FMN-containing dehydrogenase
MATKAVRSWDAFAGELVRPGAPGYDAVRPAIGRFGGILPAAVVRCRVPADVSRAVSFAAGAGLPVAIRSGGHCFAGRSSTRGLLIDMSPMATVSASDGVATVGAGARLGEVYDALSVHGVTLPAGCGPTVGIAGLTLGGGVGILGRTYGLTSDRLLGAELVLADGRVVTCDEQHHPDLYWALRGAGGGAFGVVTSLRFRPVPDAAATSFRLSWPATSAVSAAVAWQEWAPAGPDELAASLLVTATDRSRMVTVSGAMLGAESDTMALLDQLVRRVGADPATTTVRAHESTRDTKRELARLGDQVHDARFGDPYCTSEFFARSLPAGTVAELVEHLERDVPPGQLRELDFMPWGGAYNRVGPSDTAFVHRGDRFLLKYSANVSPHASTADRAAAQRWLAQARSLGRPWGTGRAYQNFPDERDQWSEAYHGTNLDRLVRIKRRYDPTGFFGDK